MPSLHTVDEPRDEADLPGQLRDGYPTPLPPHDDSRLGRMLARLSAAFAAAAARHPVPASVQADLIDLVPRLRRYAASLIPDPVEADDLVQSILLKAWVKREHLPGGPALAAWLFAVLRRTYRHERQRGSVEPAPETGRNGVECKEGNLRRPRGVRAAVDRLTRAQREVLLLVTVEGLSREAAAAIIDCPVEMVREHLAQAYDRLADDREPG